MARRARAIATLLCAALMAAPAPALAEGESSLSRRVYLRDENGTEQVYLISEYEPLSDEAARSWMLECRSGDETDAGRLLEQHSLSQADLVESDGALYAVPAETIAVGDVTYRRTQAMVRAERDGGTAVAYYVTDDAAPQDNYSVRVTFVDVANPEGAALETHQYTISADVAAQGQSQEISIPKTLRSGSYEIVDGQLSYETSDGSSRSLVHNYFSPVRTYTVFYRSADDETYANALVTLVETHAAQEGAPAAGEAKAAAETIDDDANPLAAPEAPQAASHTIVVKATMLGGLVTGLVVTGVGMFLYGSFRKRQEDGDTET